MKRILSFDFKSLINKKKPHRSMRGKEFLRLIALL